MIGMNFGEFLILAIAGLISAIVLHYAIGYRFLAGGDGFLSKWVVGWIGGWLGSPVLGHWFSTWHYENVYFIPALVGAFTLTFVATASFKAAAKAYGSQPSAQSYEMPKVA